MVVDKVAENDRNIITLPNRAAAVLVLIVRQFLHYINYLVLGQWPNP